MIVFPGFRGKLEQTSPLAMRTSWRVGGNAEYLAIPEDLEDLLLLLDQTKKYGLPFYILGRGTNLLIDDGGVPGVTVLLGSPFQYVKQEGNILIVGASTPMPSLAKEVAKLGYANFDHMVGIPGSIGAGVVINAGKGTSGDMDMHRILKNVTYITENLSMNTIDVSALDYKYRSSRLCHTPNIVVEAKFLLTKKMDRGELDFRMKAILEERREKFPLKLPNAGSVFKRPKGSSPAGKLIESSGLKGYRVGDAQVSELHANFIVNLGSATSQDIKDIISTIIEKVYLKHGVRLEREVIYWPEEANWRGV